MSMRVQDFVVSTIEKGAKDLWEAYVALPADKRNWSTGGCARTAGDMIAEIAILNNETAKTLSTRTFDMNFDFPGYVQRKSELAADEAALKALFDESVMAIKEAVSTFPDDQLSASVEFPWGTMTFGQVMGYPAWNMGYHEGQINLIGATLTPVEA